MLGRRLHETLSQSFEVMATDVAEHGEVTALDKDTALDKVTALDITDPAAVESAVTSFRPTWIVNSAAYTAVDRAETETDLAMVVNADGPEILARVASEIGARILHIGTDFVFDGEKGSPYVETDAVNPLCAYGRTKEEGERRVREACEDHVIFRIAWLFGPDGPNFVATMLRLAREHGTLRVVADQVGTPTYTRHASVAIRDVMQADLRGTIHGTNGGETTWFGLAAAAVEAAGLKIPMTELQTSDYPTPARRPANSRLHNQVLEQTIGDPMPPWIEGVRAYVAEL